MSPAAVLELRGAAYDRGRLQAELSPERRADVAAAVTRRLSELGPALALPRVVEWLDAQHAFTRDHDPDGYVEVLIAERGETVRAEPFDAIELRVGVLFGDDDDEV